MENNISFSKIVATPTLRSWSQAYNAGKFFAVLSLEKTQELLQESESLNVLGKNLLERLEQEFFTTEEKNLESIKRAISTTFENNIEVVSLSFAAGAFINNVLYLFALGKAKAFIKRDDRLERLLDSQSHHPKDIISSSGFLKERDLIVLATEAFSKVITDDELNLSLNNSLPEDIAESLAPKIHKEENGKISAIIIKYGNPKAAEIPVEALQDQGKIEEVMDEKPYSSFEKYLTLFKSKFKRPNMRFNPTKKFFLIAVVIIVGILIFSTFLTIQKQNNAKVQALFSQIYPQAQKKYDEGQSLLDLNKNLARDSFLDAAKILTDNKDKFPAKSKENAQVQILLKKVKDAITVSSSINVAEAKEVGKSSSNILSAQINNPDSASSSNFFAQDNNNIYLVNNKSVMTIDMKTKKSKEIIKNDSFWKNVGGLGTYSGNVYLLDKDSKQIFKFVSSEEGYAKANFFAQDVSPDLTAAKGMSIDGSIWILLADGTIEKFTRGKRDIFTVSGLDKPFVNPSRIFTSLDTNHLYVLDNGNSRIVVIAKDGIYKSQYQSDVLKGAKDFEVRESSKKILILSQNKIYEIGINENNK